MIISMSGQAAAFVASAAIGVVLGVIFDLFRVLRRLFRHKGVATAVQDAFFWIIGTLLTFTLFLRLNDGEMRGYLFLGLLLGAVIYFLTVSRHLTAFLLCILRAMLGFCGGKYNAAKKGLKSGGGYVKMRGKKIYTKIKRGRNGKRKPHKQKLHKQERANSN